MAGGFNINTNLNMLQFDNSIKNFNEVFSNSLDNAGKNIENTQNFNDIFNSIGNNKQTMPIKGSAEIQVGLDSINAQKIENLSPTAKMAQDIGKGFSNGLGEVSALGKQAEEAFETFAAGGDISVHEVMIASQKSGLAMQMAIQLRNQMLSAYNEFKNMSI